MASAVLLLGIVLASQIGAANDRYSGAAGQRPHGSTNNPVGESSDRGLVPVIEASESDTSPPPTAAPSAGNGSDLFGSSVTPLGGQQNSPLNNSAAQAPTNSPAPGYGRVQPQSNAPAASSPPAGQTAGPKPSVLMRDMLTPPRESRLAGQSLSLTDVVTGAATRAEQTQRIEGYWDLCSSVADYYLGLREQEELQQLRAYVPRVGPTWQQAENELAGRIGTSQRAALASQYRLASLIGNMLGSLPLPGDTPHCGNYHSHYEEIFVGRPSAEAQELSLLLPLRFGELENAASAVTRAEEWLGAIASARNENSDGTGTVRALELLALRRRAFVQIARDYNRRIARYTELATPGQIDSDRLVGMLIKRDLASTATRTSTQAAPPNRQSNNQANLPPSTFARGWTSADDARVTSATRDDGVEPASAEAQTSPTRERSLLVKPR